MVARTGGFTSEELASDIEVPAAARCALSSLIRLLAREDGTECDAPEAEEE